MSEEKERTCFNCTQFDMCFLRHRMNDATSGYKLNLDNANRDTPGTWMDLFKSLANCCRQYFELMEVEFEEK